MVINAPFPIPGKGFLLCCQRQTFGEVWQFSIDSQRGFGPSDTSPGLFDRLLILFLYVFCMKNL